MIVSHLPSCYSAHTLFSSGGGHAVLKCSDSELQLLAIERVATAVSDV